MLFVGKSYHQYDSIAFPEETSKAVDFIPKALFKFTATSENRLSVPEREVMQSKALMIYLDGFKTKLANNNLSGLCNIEYVSQRMLMIYDQLSDSVISNREGPRITWRCNELRQVCIHGVLP